MIATIERGLDVRAHTVTDCIGAVTDALRGWEGDDASALASRLSRAERACDENLPAAEGEAAYAMDCAEDMVGELRCRLFDRMILEGSL